MAIQTAAKGRIAVLNENRRAATVSSDNKTIAMSRMIAGCRLRAIASPSANQHIATSRGARQNSSPGMRTTAFGQRSGFGAFTLPVFEALPADRTHQPFHHNVTRSLAQYHYGLQMKRLWKHIDHVNFRDYVTSRHQHLQVSSQCDGVARDVDDLRR
jgi:hypothetical protein